MEAAARISLVLGLLWAATLLAVQARRAVRSGRLPFAPAVGDVRGAILFNFTTAMLPSHKESVSKHPLAFGIGMLLHGTIVISFAAILVSVARPEVLNPFVGAVAALGILAALFLLIRRSSDPELRFLSVPDDYLSIALVGVLLISTFATSMGWLPVTVLQCAAAALLFYVPLGKLRHAVFFFLARTEMGRRLGWRGVYPHA